MHNTERKRRKTRTLSLPNDMIHCSEKFSTSSVLWLCPSSIRFSTGRLTHHEFRNTENVSINVQTIRIQIVVWITVTRFLKDHAVWDVKCGTNSQPSKLPTFSFRNFWCLICSFRIYSLRAHVFFLAPSIIHAIVQSKQVPSRTRQGGTAPKSQSPRREKKEPVLHHSPFTYVRVLEAYWGSTGRDEFPPERKADLLHATVHRLVSKPNRTGQKL